MNNSIAKNGYTLYGWSEDNSNIISPYEITYKPEKDITLNAIWRENSSVAAESLIDAAEKINQTTQASINVNNENYNADVLVYNGNLDLNGIDKNNISKLENNIYEFGNAFSDVALNEEYAKNMVILKVNGDITIEEGVTLTACKSENGYGGPKGLLIYCTGTLTNNGTIDMTARGARAEGQDVYIWKNTDNSYEYVPAEGAAGGDAVVGKKSFVNGQSGKNGTDRATGGGGSGVARGFSGLFWRGAVSGAGTAGTSYSGGTGGGGCGKAYGYESYAYAGDGQTYGRNGGVIGGTGYSSKGVGNPGSSNGTGGLLIVYGEKISNKGKISSNGTDAVVADQTGGSSGGGSINIFYNKSYNNLGTIEATGGTSGGTGGDGTVTIGNISSGIFELNVEE